MIAAVLAAPSKYSYGMFYLLVAIIAVLFVKAAARATGGPDPDKPRKAVAPWIASLMVFGGWLLIPAILVQRGLMSDWSASPPPALAVIGLVTLCTIGLALSPFGGNVAARFSLAALVGFQFFRVPTELMLHGLSKQGFVPVVMTFAGGQNFDIVSGITAALLAFYLLGGGPGRKVVWLWNVVALVLLAHIMWIAAMSTPTAFRHFTEGPPNLLPGQFPWVWLPTFLVQAALFGHIVVFRALLRKPAP